MEPVMTLGDQKGLSSEINVTPMIDVLLVLLVVFMLSVQLRRILSVNLPPPTPESRPTRSSPQMVLELRSDGSYALTGVPVARAGLLARLRELTDGGNRLHAVAATYVRTSGALAPLISIQKMIGTSPKYSGIMIWDTTCKERGKTMEVTLVMR